MSFLSIHTSNVILANLVAGPSKDGDALGPDRTYTTQSGDLAVVQAHYGSDGRAYASVEFRQFDFSLNDSYDPDKTHSYAKIFEFTEDEELSVVYRRRSVRLPRSPSILSRMTGLTEPNSVHLAQIGDVSFELAGRPQPSLSSRSERARTSFTGPALEVVQLWEQLDNYRRLAYLLSDPAAVDVDRLPDSRSPDELLSEFQTRAVPTRASLRTWHPLAAQRTGWTQAFARYGDALRPDLDVGVQAAMQDLSNVLASSGDAAQSRDRIVVKGYTLRAAAPPSQFPDDRSLVTGRDPNIIIGDTSLPVPRHHTIDAARTPINGPQDLVDMGLLDLRSVDDAWRNTFAKVYLGMAQRYPIGRLSSTRVIDATILRPEVLELSKTISATDEVLNLTHHVLNRDVFNPETGYATGLRLLAAAEQMPVDRPDLLHLVRLFAQPVIAEAGRMYAFGQDLDAQLEPFIGPNYGPQAVDGETQARRISAESSSSYKKALTHALAEAILCGDNARPAARAVRETVDRWLRFDSPASAALVTENEQQFLRDRDRERLPSRLPTARTSRSLPPAIVDRVRRSRVPEFMALDMSGAVGHEGRLEVFDGRRYVPLMSDDALLQKWLDNHSPRTAIVHQGTQVDNPLPRDLGYPPARGLRLSTTVIGAPEIPTDIARTLTNRATNLPTVGRSLGPTQSGPPEFTPGDR